MASIGNLVRQLRTQAHVAALIFTRENPASIFHARRTAVAAVVSLLIARLFRLPEAYWSPISTLVIMQSTLGASLPISAQRFAGTALGAVVGGLIGSYFPGNALAFGLCVFLIGLVCAAFNVQRAAYRFANITFPGDVVTDRLPAGPSQAPNQRELTMSVLMTPDMANFSGNVHGGCCSSCWMRWPTHMPAATPAATW
jgi:hypothetical protein